MSELRPSTRSHRTDTAYIMHRARKSEFILEKLLAVWEWCNDWFSPDYHRTSEAYDPHGSSTGDAKAMRGRVLPLPRLLLQPIPRRCSKLEHT